MRIRPTLAPWLRLIPVWLPLASLAWACAPAPEPATASRPPDPAPRPEAPVARPAPAPAPIAAREPVRPAAWAPSAVLLTAWQEAAWLQDRADPRGTGSTSAVPVRSAPRILWRYADPGTSKASGPPEVPGPVVAGGGLVFFGTSGGGVHALDVATGKSRWTATSKGGVLSAPALLPGEGGGTLYVVQAESGTLSAFKAASGERQFERAVGGPLLGAPLLADGGLFLGSGAPGPERIAGAIHAFLAATGKPLWRRATGVRRVLTVKRRLFLAGVTARPSLSADGLIYATSQNGFLHAVDRRTGRSRQRESIERLAAYTPAIDGNLAFFHRGGQLFTLGQRGKILGLLTRPPKPLAAGLGSPALSSARIYVAGDGALVATNREASAPLWRHPLPEQTAEARHSAPVVAGAGTAQETVYVVDSQGLLHAVDGVSGKALWTHPVGRPQAPAGVRRSPEASAPALLPHLILLSTSKGEVLALTDAP